MKKSMTVTLITLLLICLVSFNSFAAIGIKGKNGHPFGVIFEEDCSKSWRCCQGRHGRLYECPHCFDLIHVPPKPKFEKGETL